MIRYALDKEAMLDKRKVLLVDDDMRNIFSLSSVLGEKGMHIVEATNGVGRWPNWKRMPTSTSC